MIKKSLVFLTLLLLFLSLIVKVVTATPESFTTLDTLILDADGDGRLEEVHPGEPYTVREDLGAIAQEGRAQRRQSLLFFAHLTDLHDEVQGTLPIQWRWQLIALSQRKVFGLDAVERLCGSPDCLLELQTQREADVRTVPPDRNRRLVSHRAFMSAHFATQGTPVGHGFGWKNIIQDKGYYSFEPVPGVQFVALDSVNEGGGANGSMDAEQFAWLEGQLIAHSSHYYDPSGYLIEAENKDKLLVLFSHHTREALCSPNPGPTPGDYSVLGPEFEALLHRFPNVILHVAGHTHRHKIWARQDPAGWRSWTMGMAPCSSSTPLLTTAPRWIQPRPLTPPRRMV